MSSSFIGKVVDNYRIIENLGIGGMGVVFKAIHVKLDKLFALKMIAPGLAMDQNFIKRFQTEAKALAKFEDPNIVRIYDLREYDDQWFIVMEYVEGQNLLDIIRKNGAFPLQNALSILKQILNAIEHAHSAGIIHRDLKPNNVMITNGGRVKITDFGLAKDQSSRTTTMTVTSGGTLYYMSPEHVKGFQFTDKRSDIYSIGMTFYEMITGTVPYKDLQSDFDIRESIIRKDTVKPSVYNEDIPVELEKIVMKSISKNADDRYQTADEMLKAVKYFETENPDIDSDFTLVEIQESARYTESEFKFGKVPDPTLPGHLKKTKIYLRKFGIFITPILLVLMLLYIFYPPSPVKKIKDKAPIQLSHLSISTQPSSATIKLGNDPIGESPLNQYSVTPGKYSVRISKKDYQPIDTAIVINPGNNLHLSLTLAANEIKKETIIPEIESEIRKTTPVRSIKDASIVINSQPKDAEVWLNGKLKGTTPATLSDLPPGSYQIIVQKDGYSEYKNQIVLEPGKNNDLIADLSPSGGGLSVNIDPPSAQIFIDGQEMNNAGSPLTLENIPMGSHKIEIKQSGFEPVSEEIEINQGQILNKTYSLVRQSGRLSVQVRPWGSIYINNELKKESADTKYNVTLPVEEYKVKVSHPTLGIWEKNITIGPDKEEEIVVNFNRKVKVTISAFDENGLPLNAGIFIDDRDAGTATPSEIKIPVGIHKLEIKLEGYTSTNTTKKIFVDKGVQNEHTIILKKNE